MDLEIAADEDSFQKFYDFLETSINKIKLQPPKQPLSQFAIFLTEKSIEARYSARPADKKNFTKRCRDLWEGLSQFERQKYQHLDPDLADDYQELMQEYNMLKASKRQITPYSLFYKESFNRLLAGGPITDVPRKVSQAWKKLSQKERKQFEEKAQAENICNRRKFENREQRIDKYILKCRAFRKRCEKQKTDLNEKFDKKYRSKKAYKELKPAEPVEILAEVKKDEKEAVSKEKPSKTIVVDKIMQLKEGKKKEKKGKKEKNDKKEKKQESEDQPQKEQKAAKAAKAAKVPAGKLKQTKLTPILYKLRPGSDQSNEEEDSYLEEEIKPAKKGLKAVAKPTAGKQKGRPPKSKEAKTELKDSKKKANKKIVTLRKLKAKAGKKAQEEECQPQEKTKIKLRLQSKKSAVIQEVRQSRRLGKKIAKRK